MEQVKEQQKTKRRTVSEIQSILEAFSISGITVQSFCEQQNIGKSTFHKWQSRYKNKQHQSACGSFADIEIISGEAQRFAALFAEVKGIKIYQPVSAAYLKALLA